MERLALGSARNRRDLFTETADAMGVAARIVEKDFWVCWTLKQLFSLPGCADYFTFKGGTTLSKIFGVITRFSEDVDVAINWEPLGFVGERNPDAPRSKTKTVKLLGEMLEACRKFIAGDLKRDLERQFDGALNQDWRVELDPNNPDALRFYYPKALSMERSYVGDPVVLELGTHAELTPSGEYEVTPYASEHFPGAFEEASARVRAMAAERTFWEKATILHAEHHRPAEKPTPLRYSRHYYDTVMLARSEYGERALKDVALLERVVAHKRKFYPSAWARYDLAVPGSLKLVPSTGRLDDLRKDYASMAVMFFGSRPQFEELMDELEGLERIIHGVKGDAVQP